MLKAALNMWFLRIYKIIALLFLGIVVIPRVAYADTCNSSDTESLFDSVKAGITSLDGESLFVEQLNKAEECNASKRQIIEAKYKLASLWEAYGVELAKAKNFQTEVAAYYWPKRKWNRARYARAVLSLAEINYQQGNFLQSYHIIRQLDTDIPSLGPLPETVTRNRDGLKFLLAIALDNVVEVPVTVDSIAQDVALFELQNSYGEEESSASFSSDVRDRNALKRIIRWNQWRYHTGQKLSQSYGIEDLDYRIKSRLGKKYTDDLYIDYSISRLAFIEDSRCQSYFSKFILERLKSNQIESQSNKIAALALRAECGKNKNKAKFIEQYISSLKRFYQTMPLDFSVEVFFSLNVSQKSLIENVDWSQIKNGWQVLFELLQLKERATIASTSSRFDPKGIANPDARKLFAKREELKNTFFKYNKPHLQKKYQIQISEVQSALEEVEKTINDKFPRLSRFSTTQIKSVNSIKAELAGNEQFLLIGGTERLICNIHLSSLKTKGSCTAFNKHLFSKSLNHFVRSTINGMEGIQELSSKLTKSVINIELLEPDKPYLLVNTNVELSRLPLNLMYNDAKSRWLVEDYNIERHLSLMTLGSRNSSAPQSFASRIAIADPIFNFEQNKNVRDNPDEEIESFRSSVVKMSTAKEALQQLSRLPNTVSEATKFVTEAKQGRVLKQRKANEKEIFQALKSPWDIVVFSTHTIFPEMALNLDYPALALTPISEFEGNDGLLTSSEIANLSLNNAWVILAACDTANSIGKRNSLGSLLDAFLLSGSRSVLASHWKVNDKETFEFMATLSDSLDEYSNESDALWAARKKMLKHSKPRVWSSFDLYF